MTEKTALVTGFTGQDGGYLSLYLLGLGYKVIGLIRRVSTEPPVRLRQTELNQYLASGQLELAYGNLEDHFSILDILKKYQPDEIYNLAAQSHVGISWHVPDETFDINYHGVSNIIRAVKFLGLPTKIYQASTSEMFGSSPKKYSPQNESTPFEPISPYAIAKLAAHWSISAARNEDFGQPIYAASGILFNHESPYRGENFVTRKITVALAKIFHGQQEILELGNLSAERDWGFAGDYVKAMHAILQQSGNPSEWKDYVIATGEKHTVREFVETACKSLGWNIAWEGEGENERGYINGVLRVRVNPAFYRPNEVWTLCGDSSMARNELGWKPETSFEQLVDMMMQADLKRIEQSSDKVLVAK